MPNKARSLGSPAGGSPLWNSVLLELQGKLPAERGDGVARHALALEVTRETLTLGVPPEPLQRWLQDGTILAIGAVLTSLTDETCELAIIPVFVRPSGAEPLSSFTASPSNRAALHRVAAVVENPGQDASPLLLHGPPGSGRTHLLRAIAYELAQRGGAVRQRSANEFSLELVAAIRADKLAHFQAKLRGVSALLLDNIETLAGRDASQEELAQTLAALRKTRAQVVLTARHSLSQLEQIQKPLRDQLATGVSLELRTPEWETRVAIVLDRIARWGVEARPEVASEIVSHLGVSLQRLDALLTTLMTQPQRRECVANPALVRRLLAQGPRQTAPASPESILALVIRHFNLRASDLRTGTRTPRITAPRQIAMYLLRIHCRLSFPEIGQRLHRHHTTAMYAFRKIERQREENASLHATLSLLEKELLMVSTPGG